MTVLKLDTDTHSPNLPQAAGRARSATEASVVQPKGGSHGPPDFVEASVGSVREGASALQAKGEELERKLADPGGGHQGNDLAMLDDIMGIYMFQVQMAKATGNTERAEMVAKMAVEMVDRARIAVVGAREGIAIKSAGDPAAAQQGLAELARTVQSIAVRARSVASVAAAARAASEPAKGNPPEEPGRSVEDAIRAMVEALHGGSDPAATSGNDGKSGSGTDRAPAVIFSTEA